MKSRMPNSGIFVEVLPITFCARFVIMVALSTMLVSACGESGGGKVLPDDKGTTDIKDVPEVIPDGGLEVDDPVTPDVPEVSDEGDIPPDVPQPDLPDAPDIEKPDVPCTGNDDCYQGNPCEFPICFNGKCSYTPIQGCIACTLDVDASVTDVECDDQDPCTTNNCVRQDDKDSMGQCEYAINKCFDDNPCTLDSCDPLAGCINTDIDGCYLCGPKYDDPLTPEPTDPQSPEKADEYCDDVDSCKKGACNFVEGYCLHQPIVCETNYLHH